MRQHNNHFPRRRGATQLIALACCVGALVAVNGGPAAARQDAGTPRAYVTAPGGCSLQRTGTMFVRCDNNTGNGVPAPAWIPQR